MSSDIIFENWSEMILILIIASKSLIRDFIFLQFRIFRSAFYSISVVKSVLEEVVVAELFMHSWVVNARRVHVQVAYSVCSFVIDIFCRWWLRLGWGTLGFLQAMCQQRFHYRLLPSVDWNYYFYFLRCCEYEWVDVELSDCIYLRVTS